MHRLKTRRWHKLLSVSGIIVAVFGMVAMPMANAQPGGPRPDGIYGPSFSKMDYQVQYVDFPENVAGLESTDFLITGTATGCVIGPIPNVVAYSFGIMVTGCSDGVYRLTLKAESVSYPGGPTGPTYQYRGSDTTIDRTPLQVIFQNTPVEVSTPFLQWEIAINHPFAPQSTYDLTVLGSGCSITTVQTTTFGLSVAVDGCVDGTQAGLVVNPNFIMDYFENVGPVEPVASRLVQVTYPVAIPEPTPAPTASAEQTPPSSPTPDPVASPAPTPVETATPAPTPSATPTAEPTPTLTPSETPQAVVVAPAPEPPAPPTPPTQPVPPVVQAPPEPEPEPEPVPQPQPQPEPEPEPTVQQEPLPEVSDVLVMSQPMIAELFTGREATVKPIALVQEVQVEEPEPEILRETAPIIPVIETSATPSIDWQPIGNIAIGLGGTAATVGVAIYLKRVVRVRRLKFS